MAKSANTRFRAWEGIIHLLACPPGANDTFYNEAGLGLLYDQYTANITAMLRQRAKMLRHLTCLLTASLYIASPSLSAQDFSQPARQADFTKFITDFKENYTWPNHPGKSWETWQSRYAAAVDSADSPEAYAAVIESALDELHDFHAEVRSRNPHRWLPVPTFADIWAEMYGETATVVAVRRGSDAERSGISPGNHITHIGDDPLAKAIADRLTPAVDNRDPKSRAWALLSILAGRSDEMRRFTVIGSSGQSRQVTLPVERRFDRSPGPLSVTVLPGNFGMVRFNNSLGEQKTIKAFDDALEQLQLTRGLILDLRDVPSGGDSSVALGIMGRFIQISQPYQRHKIPNYGQPDVERNWIELVTPRGPFTYKAPLVVLVDHWTGSMGEGIAIGFDAMHRAAVVGTPMAHLAGAVSDFRLPRTQIDVAFATEKLYHVNGTPREDWLPPVLVTTPVTVTNDPILARGLSKLRR